MKKILVLILTLVLAFGVTAFAGEDTPGLPGTQGGAQEAGASQAFSRSLDVYGIYQWRYEYLWSKTEGTDTKTVSSKMWHTLQAYFTYNISENLMLKFAVSWGSYYGQGRTYATYDKLTGTNYDTVEWLVRNFEEFPSTGFANTGAVNGGGNNWQVIVRQMYMVWKVGPPFGELRIGRLPVVWGFHSLCLPAYSGADRIVWVGDMKLGSMRFLPLAIFEIRKDATSAMKDEQLFVALGFIGFAPGKMLEQIWLNISAFLPTKNVQTLQYVKAQSTADSTGTWAYLSGTLQSEAFDPIPTGKLLRPRWKVAVMDVYVKMRMGNMLEINFEILGFMGSKAEYINPVTEDTTARKWTFLQTILSVAINLGTIKITPEFAMTTAPMRKIGAGGIPTADGYADGWGFFSNNYQVGGALMMDLTRTTLYGVFSASVLAEVSLGKLGLWLKPSIAWVMSKYKYDAKALSGAQRYVETNTKALGFEIDLGVTYEIADGFTAGLEIDFWLPGKYVKDWESGKELAFGIKINLDLKF